MSVPEFIQPWLGSGTVAAVIFYALSGVLLAAALVGGWLLLGRGPRRRRAFRRAERLLRQGAWSDALAIIQDLSAPLRESARWQSRLTRAEGACYRSAGEGALQDRQYEISLEHFIKAARLLHLPEADVRDFVVETMLVELRRLFASEPPGSDKVQALVQRILAIQAACPEAYFWQGLGQVGGGILEPAIASLMQARELSEAANATRDPRGKAGPVGAIDPPLYLGALHLRAGRPEEAIRFLSEANRIDAACPFVTWQLGTAMLAAGGEALIAVKALQRALGPRGLQLWVKTPQRAWVEGFPEKRSFVRRLASHHPYPCPVFGADVAVMIRQGQITLGQGHYRLGNFGEAAKVFHHLLEESAPSLPVLRGLGLALARLEQFDEAFKHLRAAHEMEDPKNYLTAGYLALCGARGKPTRPEDKVKNVQWAVRLVSRFHVPGNAEWAHLLNLVFAEARSAGTSVALEDQARLCAILGSVDAVDPLAAAAYAQFAGAFEGEALGTPAGDRTGEGGDAEAVRDSTLVDGPRRPSFRPEYAWLFCRAAQRHSVTADRDLELFAHTFATEAAARTFFAQRQWDFDEVELAYLERWAARQPGSFPVTLGPDYPPRGERLLLGRSQWLEQLQDQDGAIACTEVLLRLAPRNPAAHDRLAYLAYQGGDLDRACGLLHEWHRLFPNNPVPLMRRAVIEQQRGNPAARAEAIGQALAQTQGAERAEVAFLGARLAMQEWLRHSPTAAPEASRNGEQAGRGWHPAADAGRAVLDLLHQCLHEVPDHQAALWCLGAVCCLLAKLEELARQAAVMGRIQERTEGLDPRFDLLAAVCQLTARSYSQAAASARRAAARDPGLAAECAYLQGLALLQLDDRDAALRSLRQAALDSQTPAKPYAQALLGNAHFARGDYGQAIRWWQALDAIHRQAWGLEEPLRNTLLVAALEAFAAARYQEAADRVGEAGRLGLRDRRLGSLLTAALVKAGQELLYHHGP
jgi:tetratricopeptide (TPR) repeat protein